MTQSDAVTPVSSGNRKLLAAGLGAMLVGLAMPGYAQDRGPGSEGSASLGYVGTSGNTDTQTFESQLRYTLRTTEWVHNLGLQALLAEQDSISSGERYVLEGKSDFRVGENSYFFGKGNYTDDRFTGYDYQVSAATGYGYYWSNTDELLLETFAGAGYRQNAFVDGGDEGEIMLSLGQNLEWAITNMTSLTQSLSSEIGEDLTSSRFEIGLISNIIGEISTKIAFQARHLSEVPAGRKNTDTQTSISLVYQF